MKYPRLIWLLMIVVSVGACDDDDSETTFEDSSTAKDAEILDVSVTADAADARLPDSATDAEANSDSEPDGSVASCAEDLEENEVCIPQDGVYPGRIPQGEGKAQYYRIKVSERSSFAFKLTREDGSTCPDEGLSISLQQKNGNSWQAYQSSIDGREGECLEGFWNLEPGEYRAVVTEFEGKASSIALHATFGAYHICGNGELDQGEECDDGGILSGDGCSSRCTVERNFSCTEPDSTSPSVCRPLPPGDHCDLAIEVTQFPYELSGRDFCSAFTHQLALQTPCHESLINTESPEVIFKVELDANEKLTLTESGPMDAFISFLNGECRNEARCIDGYSIDANYASKETLSYAALEPQTLYAVVSLKSACNAPSAASDGRNDYNISLTKSQVICGDGHREGYEECDVGAFESEGCRECRLTEGWACIGTICHEITCGDGWVDGDEECDTQGKTGEGCDTSCSVEAGFSCVNYVERVQGDVCYPLPMGEDGFICVDNLDRVPGSICYPSTLAAGDGTSCSDAGLIDTPSFRAVGDDFSAQFANGFKLNGYQCNAAPFPINSNSPTAFYKLHLQPQEIVEAYLTAQSDAIQLALLESCSQTASCLDEQSDNEGRLRAKVSYIADSEKDVYLIARIDNNAPDERADSYAYELIVNTHRAQCGDGIVEGKEPCDDGNTVSNDGCSADCTIEPGFICQEGSPSACYTHSLKSGDAQSCETAGEFLGNSFETSGQYFGEDFLETIKFDVSGSPCDGLYANETYPAAIYRVALEEGELLNASMKTDFNIGGIFILTGDNCENLTCRQSLNYGYQYFGSRLSYLASESEEVYVVYAAAFSSHEHHIYAPYEISIEHHMPLCGDGRIELDEQCDDGPFSLDETGQPKDGDGCSSDCQVEPFFGCTGSPSACRRTDPGDACKTPIVADFDGNGEYSYFTPYFDEAFENDWTVNENCGNQFSSNIAPEAFYQIDLEANELLEISNLANSRLYTHLYLMKDDCHSGQCVNLFQSLTQDQQVQYKVSYQATEAETVYLVAEGSSFLSENHLPFGIRFKKHLASCGDGIREGNEECDTGNAYDAACTDCKVTPGMICTNQTPNKCFPAPEGDVCEKPIRANLIDGHFEFSGENFGHDFTSQWTGDSFACNAQPFDSESIPEVFFQIDLSEGDVVTIQETGPITMNISYLEDPCGPTCLYAEPAYDGGHFLGMSYTATRDGTVYATAEPESIRSNLSQPYHFNIDVRHPSCGDGVIEGDEECDDRNTSSGDGCASDCKLEDNYICRGDTNSRCRQAAPGDRCQNAIEPSFGSSGYGTITIEENNAFFDEIYTDQFRSSHSSCRGIINNDTGGLYAEDVIYRFDLLKGDQLTIDGTQTPFASLITIVGEVDGSCGSVCYDHQYNFDPIVYGTNQDETIYVILSAQDDYPGNSHDHYAITFTKSHSICGNDILEAGEECDVSHAGCNANCTVKSGYQCINNHCSFLPDRCEDAVELEDGNMVTFDNNSTSDTISSVESCGISTSYGRDLFYKFRVPPHQQLIVQLESENSSMLNLYLMRSCDESSCIAASSQYNAAALYYTNQSNSEEVLYIGCDAMREDFYGRHLLQVSLYYPPSED